MPSGRKLDFPEIRSRPEGTGRNVSISHPNYEVTQSDLITSHARPIITPTGPVRRNLQLTLTPAGRDSLMRFPPPSGVWKTSYTPAASCPSLGRSALPMSSSRRFTRFWTVTVASDAC